MIQGSLEPTGDETLEQAKSVINLLAKAKRYRSGPNSIGMGKTIVTLYRWCIPPALVCMAITIMVEVVVGRPLSKSVHPLLYWGTNILSGLALAACIVVIVAALALLWWNRKRLTENEAHHLRSGYLLHERQVREIAVYPLSVLQSVSRYFEQRPLSGQGIHMAFLGKGELTLTTVAVLLTSINQLSELHAFGMKSNDDLLFVVWLSLLTLLYVSALMRWFARKEDYQRGLLEDAIALVNRQETAAS